MDESVQEQSIPTALQPQPPDMPATTEVPETGVKPPRKFPRFVIILLIVLVIGGILAYFLLQRLDRTKPAATDAQKTIRQSPTPQSQTPHYVGSQTITLRDLTGSISSGTASRKIDSDNISVLLEAGLPDPEEGQFYQAWLIKTGDDYLPLTKLSKNIEGKYTSTNNVNIRPSDSFLFSDLYNTVVVGLETTEDNTIETKILEGTFTQ